MRARQGALVPAVALLAFVGACADAEPTTTTSSSEPAPSTTTPSTTEPTPSETAAGEDEAYATVDAWLAATATGDPDQVLAVLGPSSTAAVERMGGMGVLMSGLAEGMSTYAQPGMTKAAVQVRPGTWLVTYSGERQVEGTTDLSARSWLVVETTAGPRVEAFVQPLPELVSPPDPLQATSADVVAVTLPAGGEVHAYLDGTTEVPVTTTPVDGDQVQLDAAPEGGLPTGRHSLSFVTLPPAGAEGVSAVETVVLSVTG